MTSVIRESFKEMTFIRFHFGQISTARAVLYAKKHSRASAGITAFTEEVLVRGELSDNFCYYNENYNNVCAFAWFRFRLKEF